MASPDDQKNEVQQATDLIRLIGEHVILKPRGKEYIGLCPFHDDKNPSMYVSPAKQIYKCFSCGAGGDAFSFVMNYHKMSFPEALKFLAERAGIKLRPRSGFRVQGSGTEEEGPTDRERIADANAKAVGFFRALLRHGEHGRVAREYIAQRKISPEMVEAFQLGYAADRWDGLMAMIRDKNWDLKSFEMAGLVSPRGQGGGFRVQGSGKESGAVPANASSSSLNPEPRTLNPEPSGHYDRLRHRLIFPIFDAIGRPIAFGGRKLREQDEPKYLNSPESKLFNKSATLYGLHVAKKPIIDSKTAVIVEGYTNVIACHQAGVRNVVATLGTALTIQHVQALKHFAEKVVLIYDGDEAGQKAADRAVEVFLTGSLDVAFAVLPEGLDPAELFELPDGMEQWNRAVDQAMDALDFQFRRVRMELEAATTITGRQRIAEDYLTKLAQLGLAQMPMLRKALVLPRLAELLHLSETAIQDLVKRLAPTRRPVASTGSVPDNTKNNMTLDVASPASEHKIKALAQAERHLIGCLLRQPNLFHQVLTNGGTLDETVTPMDFLTTSGKRLYERVYQQLCDGLTTTMQSILADLAADSESDLAALATQAEAEVEACTADHAEKVTQLLQAAASAILNYHRELEYETTKQGFVNAEMRESETPSGTELGADSGADEKLKNIRQLVEHRKANPMPRPTRIARLGS